jgi:hypothetical protein
MGLEKPPIRCTLAGINGNAFSLMGHWQLCARKAGWKPDEIKKVLDEAMSGDYSHLLQTLLEHCE